MDIIIEKYNKWLNDDFIDNHDKEELLSYKNNEKEIRERFSGDLEFGTGGLRGMIGLGSNRFNIYSAGKVTQGLSNYLLEKYNKNIAMVVGYDARVDSHKIATRVAEIFTGNGIKVYIFPEYSPTPLVSFAIRELKAQGGVMITASHNPYNYNGYKAYGEDGSQFFTDESKKITEKIDSIEKISDINIMNVNLAKEKNIIQNIPYKMIEKYTKKVLNITLEENINKDINIIYTPLHGVGGKYVLNVLKKRKFNSIQVVQEQYTPNGEFPTTKYPNPEYLEVFELSKKLAKKAEKYVLIATDPDSDRVGVMIKRNKEYIHITGNQIGTLLIDYIVNRRQENNILEDNSVIIKTIVTDDFSFKIGKKKGLKVIESLTGFKNIADATRKLESHENYLFGYEESIGYLPENFIMDKDGISSAMLIAEMAGFYSKKGLDLKDRLTEIYKEYGFISEKLYSIQLKDDMKKIDKIMKKFREHYFEDFEGLKLTSIIDFQLGIEKNVVDGYSEKIDFPKENVMKYIFGESGWCAIRPSGTEPKIKIYIYGYGKDKECSDNIVIVLNEKIESIIKESRLI